MFPFDDVIVCAERNARSTTMNLQSTLQGEKWHVLVVFCIVIDWRSWPWHWQMCFNIRWRQFIIASIKHGLFRMCSSKVILVEWTTYSYLLYVTTRFVFKIGIKHSHDVVIKWNCFRLTGPLCGEFTDHRLISLTKFNGAKLLSTLEGSFYSTIKLYSEAHKVQRIPQLKSCNDLFASEIRLGGFHIGRVVSIVPLITIWPKTRQNGHYVYVPRDTLFRPKCEHCEPTHMIWLRFVLKIAFAG